MINLSQTFPLLILWLGMVALLTSSAYIRESIEFGFLRIQSYIWWAFFLLIHVILVTNSPLLDGISSLKSAALTVSTGQYISLLLLSFLWISSLDRLWSILFLIFIGYKIGSVQNLNGSEIPVFGLVTASIFLFLFRHNHINNLRLAIHQNGLYHLFASLCLTGVALSIFVLFNNPAYLQFLNNHSFGLFETRRFGSFIKPLIFILPILTSVSWIYLFINPNNYLLLMATIVPTISFLTFGFGANSVYTWVLAAIAFALIFHFPFLNKKRLSL